MKPVSRSVVWNSMGQRGWTSRSTQASRGATTATTCASATAMLRRATRPGSTAASCPSIIWTAIQTTIRAATVDTPGTMPSTPMTSRARPNERPPSCSISQPIETAASASARSSMRASWTDVGTRPAMPLVLGQGWRSVVDGVGQALVEL